MRFATAVVIIKKFSLVWKRVELRYEQLRDIVIRPVILSIEINSRNFGTLYTI